jgi:threonine dehydrogenase-like Zn-dependent dehydrogenase
MKAVTWQGKRNVRVDDVPDPRVEEPTDAVIRVTSTAICGSDLHLYEVLGMFMTPGDILGHEAMGIVEAVGSDVNHISVGDRVVIPFNIACGTCFMCKEELFAQCETTQVREYDMGAALFGYTKLYGRVPGGQAQFLRVPFADTGPIKVPDGPPDDRFLFLSDVLPTAYQAVEFAEVPPGESLAVVGLGPIGLMSVRLALHRGLKVFGIDLVPARLQRAAQAGATIFDASNGDALQALRDATQGRGPHSVIDAVGMEAHGDALGKLAQSAAGLLPDSMAEKMVEKAGLDRLAALKFAINAVRRGGTLSIIGVYGGQLDPMPMLTLFDKGVSLRMGQAHVRRWVDDLLPLVLDDSDPLGTEHFASHHLPLDRAPDAYRMFQRKEDDAVKVVLRP